MILNGIEVNAQGHVDPMLEPYSGSNLFSLASGGAIFVRDPYLRIGPEQLNGGELGPFTARDWELIRPYLEENERLFGISIEDHLLTVDGQKRTPEQVYRSVHPMKKTILTGSEEWE